jgi:hypothetical protein
MNIVMVEHTNSSKRYLFSVPEGANLGKGQRVLVDTRYGQQEAVCAADSVEADEVTLKYLAPYLGATLPLRSVTHIAEWREVGAQKPAADCEAPKSEDKPAGEGDGAITLYCVESCILPIHQLTKGKLYKFTSGKGIDCDDGYCSGCATESETYESWAENSPGLAAKLVKCVNRHAEIGEWIVVTRNSGGPVLAGTVWQVIGQPSRAFYGIRSSEHPLEGGNYYMCVVDNCLVLDGYDPEAGS